MKLYFKHENRQSWLSNIVMFNDARIDISSAGNITKKQQTTNYHSEQGTQEEMKITI